MFLNSIRWRLQIWYGLILVVVLAGFGIVAFQLERGRVLRRVDDELHRRGQLLANVLAPPRRPGPRRFMEQLQNREPRPPEDDFPPGEDDEQPPRRFQLPQRLVALFDESGAGGYYFVLRRNGADWARSTNAPPQAPLAAHKFERPFRPRGANSGPPLEEARGPISPVNGGTLREIELPVFGRGGEITWIVVGHSIAKEMSELHLAALRLTGIGGCILLFGLAGGWWIATRAIRPIKAISDTATKISAGDLAQRISIAETESELGQLAGVLNSTFARLEAAFKQQRQFTSDAAHELRTPVSVMLTQTQSALNRERSAAEYRETVEACRRAAQRMRRLIESLLELARFDAGQEQVKRLPFDFAKTIQDCADLVQPLAVERNVRMSCDLAAVQCSGDSERIAQVVTNLLTNAIQYNQPGGEVRVQLKTESNVAVLEVADTGTGIPAEDLPRVFERFYRADKSRSGSGNAGLGLAICQAIIQAHGGSIEVASEVGKGSVFTVRLPTMDEERA